MTNSEKKLEKIFIKYEKEILSEVNVILSPKWEREIQRLAISFVFIMENQHPLSALDMADIMVYHLCLHKIIPTQQNPERLEEICNKILIEYKKGCANECKGTEKNIRAFTRTL